MGKVIKFYHPGGEETVSHIDLKRGICSWHTGKHGRKYLSVKDGIYVDANGSVQTGNIGFWGEWEAETEVSKITPQKPSYHKYTHKPIVPVKNPKGMAEESKKCGIKGVDNIAYPQNTDPCVFCDKNSAGEFLYALCQQKKDGKDSTLLKGLEKGDVVVFGSHLARKFIIDTVFVVAESIPYSGKTIGKFKESVPDWYFPLTLNHVAPDACFTLYKGATYDNPVDGMYSFFPCVIDEKINSGFQRPNLEDFNSGQTEESSSKIFDSNQKQGIRKIELSAQAVWQKIVAKVYEENLSLGVKAPVK